MIPNIDWSKAPEGTTHHALQSAYPWHKHDGAGDFYFADGGWFELTRTADECRKGYGEENFVARPSEADALEAFTRAIYQDVGIEPHLAERLFAKGYRKEFSQ